MQERLAELEAEYEQVLSRLADPSVVSDQQALKDAARRHKELEGIVGCYRDLQVATADLVLQVGGSTDVVEVTGAPPVIDTTSTQLGAVVNERSSTQLPLNQRDVYQLLQLQPGVQSQLGNDLFYGSDKAGVVTVNGGRGRSNNYTVNGGDGNDLFANLPAIEPSPDSIGEFKVISNAFDAEYGRNSGAVVNVVTKSGTNDLHGSFYEFFRNDVLNAHENSIQAEPVWRHAGRSHQEGQDLLLWFV